MNLKISGQIAGLETIPNTCMAKHAPLSIMNKPILIIDDDRPGRRVLQLLLESHAFDCKEADDGREGLTHLDGGLSVEFSQSLGLSCEWRGGACDFVKW